jgi:hypothetical protein
MASQDLDPTLLVDEGLQHEARDPRQREQFNENRFASILQAEGYS